MPLLPYPERLREKLEVRQIKELMQKAEECEDDRMSYDIYIQIILKIDDFQTYLRKRDAARAQQEKKKKSCHYAPMAPKPAHKHNGKGR